MFVFIPGSIPPVRCGPGGTDPPDGSMLPVTYTYNITHLKFFCIMLAKGSSNKKVICFLWKSTMRRRGGGKKYFFLRLSNPGPPVSIRKEPKADREPGQSERMRAGLPTMESLQTHFFLNTKK